MASRDRDFSAGGRRPGFPGLYGPLSPPKPSKPNRLAVLETDGWATASQAAKEAFGEALAKLEVAGVTLASGRESRKVAAIEDAIHAARELSVKVIAWESRWPINTYRTRNAGKLSRAMLDLGAQAEAMTLDDYRRALKERAERRAVYQELVGEFDACITLAAPGAAPAGNLDWTETRHLSCPDRCSAFRRSPFRFLRTAACRSGFSFWASPTGTRRSFRPPAACSRSCSRRRCTMMAPRRGFP